MAGKQKSGGERKEDREYNYRAFRLTQLLGLANVIVRYGAMVLIAYMGYLTVESLSGENTAANIGIKMLADLRVSTALAWLFGAGGVGYGMKQRNLRRSNIERMEARIKELEGEVDPGRSTSKLTPRGLTNPEDKL
jgi:hypothetical protein